MVVDNIGVAQLKVIEGPRSVSPSPERPCVPCPAVQLDKGVRRNANRSARPGPPLVHSAIGSVAGDCCDSTNQKKMLPFDFTGT